MRILWTTSSKIFIISYELNESVYRISACDPACTSVSWKVVGDKLTLELLGTPVDLFLNICGCLRVIGIIFRYTVLHLPREVRIISIKEGLNCSIWRRKTLPDSYDKLVSASNTKIVLKELLNLTNLEIVLVLKQALSSGCQCQLSLSFTFRQLFFIYEFNSPHWTWVQCRSDMVAGSEN